MKLSMIERRKRLGLDDAYPGDLIQYNALESLTLSFLLILLKTAVESGGYTSSYLLRRLPPCPLVTGLRGCSKVSFDTVARSSYLLY